MPHLPGMEIKRIAEWAEVLGLPIKLLRREARRGKLVTRQFGRGPNSPRYCSRADIDGWLEKSAAPAAVRRAAW